MKFGKVLQQSIELSSPEWENLWVNYKQLKRIIKDCAQVSKHDKLKKEKLAANKIQNGNNDTIRQSPDELNFFRTVRAEMAKITELFLKEQARYSECVNNVEKQFESLKNEPDPNQTKKTLVMSTCVALFKEMLLLENFALINYCGISKILKKHDKWTGYNTRSKFVESVLNKQPFSTYSLLLSMINRVEQIFMKATGSTIAQHDNSSANTKMDRALEVQCGYSMLQLSAEEKKSQDTTTEEPKTLQRQVSLHDLSALREDSFRFKRTEETLSPVNSCNSNSEDDAYDGCEEDASPRLERTKRARVDEESADAGSKKMSFSTILN